MKNFLTHIDEIVGTGKPIISGQDCNIIGIVKEAITSGRTASFYLTPDQANAIRAWYWTPERIKRSGIKVISSEERNKIASELGIEHIGSFRCTRVECGNGHSYGAFEFFQQGIREHGADAVKAVFAMKNTTFLQANPSMVLVCPQCDQLLGGGIEYDCDRYGGCCYQDPE